MTYVRSEAAKFQFPGLDLSVQHAGMRLLKPNGDRAEINSEYPYIYFDMNGLGRVYPELNCSGSDVRA